MATSKKKYTKREDNKIIKEVSQHSENLSLCFFNLSQELHRSESSIKQRWNKYIKPELRKHPKKYAFILGDKAKLNPMTRNVPRGKEVRGISLDKEKCLRLVEVIFSILSE